MIILIGSGGMKPLVPKLIPGLSFSDPVSTADNYVSQGSSARSSSMSFSTPGSVVSFPSAPTMSCDARS